MQIRVRPRILPALFVACVLSASDKPSGDRNDSQKSSNKDESNVTVQPHRRIRLAGVAVGAGFTRFSGPAYGPWGYYAPWAYSLWGYPYFGYDPYFYHPFFGTGFARGPGMGEVRLRTEPKTAEVFIDGAYAGTVADLKTLWLEPGAYNIEVRSSDEKFQRRIYVLSGKTLRIDARLQPAGPQHERQEEKP
jgi:hypothetical protein